MTRWLWRTLGSLGATIVLAAAAGSALPKTHVAVREAAVRAAPEDVWTALVEVEAQPAWRPGLKGVERLEDRYGNLTWRETGARQAVVYEATESVPRARQVRTIIGRDLPYGGNWVIEIAAMEGGSRIRLTENGEIYNPLFRLAARYVFGYTAAMDAFLRDLRRKFGES